MDISVIIPNYNGGENLRRTLESLAKQDAPVAEVLVIDNGSSDHSQQIVSSAGAKWVALGRNTGFAVAVNEGIRQARSPLLFILNNDVVLSPSWTRLTLATMSNGGAWFVCGKLLSDRDHSVLDGSFDLVCRGGTSWRAGHGRLDQDYFGAPRPVAMPPFTAVLARKSLFDQVGLLDEAFGSYLEDVEFGLRCAGKRLSGVYVPDAVAYHIGSATLGRWHPRVVRQISRNQVLLIARRYSSTLVRRFRWEIVLAQLLWGFMALRHGRLYSWAAGKVEGIRSFRTLREPEPSELGDVLCESESMLFELQTLTGFDTYWRLYFTLARR